MASTSTLRRKVKRKISRRVGAPLWGEAKDPSIKKNYPPGQHGPLGRMRALSDYGKQLLEKQKMRRYYNIKEGQFRSIYKEAARRKGDTGENLIGLLECRLDALIYRTSFVPTIFAARQFVTHKHVLVNGKTVNVPSFRLKEGDIVEIKKSSRELPMVIEATQQNQREVPEYIETDFKNFTAKFLRLPQLADVPYAIEMQPNLIIEFYSR